MRPAIPFEDKFIPEPNSGCWLWTGYCNRHGYGVQGGVVLAHRHSWTIYRGPIGSKWVLHKCDIRCCVNPDHLFLGDVAANVADMMAKGRNVAPRGEKQGRAKLTEAQVLAIRSDPRKQRAIAASYDVSRSLISVIKSRRLWGHVE